MLLCLLSFATASAPLAAPPALAPFTATPPDPQPRFPSRAEVVRSVLSGDPGAQAAAAEVAAANHAARGAAFLSPLVLEGSVAPLMMEGLGAELQASWMLPAPRMRASQGAVGRAEAGAAAAQLGMTRAELAAAASRLVDEVWEIAALRAVLDHHDSVLAAAGEAVGRRVGAGLATPEQRVMADMARVEVAEARLQLDRRARAVEAELDARIDVCADATQLRGLRAWTRRSGAPPDPGPAFGVHGAASSPAVEMAAADAAMAREMEVMAGRAALPMTELMAGYSSMWGEPEMGLMVGVGVEVPLDGPALRARHAAASARRAAAEARVAAAQSETAAELGAAEAMVEEAEAMEALMRDRMVPLAAERVRLARTAFETNRGSLADWLLAERDDTATAQRLIQARAERHRAEAMVAMARGQLAGSTEEVR